LVHFAAKIKAYSIFPYAKKKQNAVEYRSFLDIQTIKTGRISWPSRFTSDSALGSGGNY